MYVTHRTSKNTGSGILTGKRNLLTGRQFLRANSRTVNEDGAESRTPSYVQQSDLQNSEDDGELMQYLSQVDTKKTINWGTVDDLDDSKAFSDVDLEDLVEKADYFLKPNKSVYFNKDSIEVKDSTTNKENRVSNIGDLLHDSNTTYSTGTDPTSTNDSLVTDESDNTTEERSSSLGHGDPTSTNDSLVTDESDNTTEERSSSLRHGALRDHIFTLDQLGIDLSVSEPINVSEESELKGHSDDLVMNGSLYASLSKTSCSENNIIGEKRIQADSDHDSSDSSVHTSLTVTEDLDTIKTSTKLTEGDEDVYSDKFEEVTNTKDSSAFSVSVIEDTGKESTRCSSSGESFKLNVISELPNLDVSERSDSHAVTSVDYTMDFDSSESQNTELSRAAGLHTKHQSVMNASTQTLAGDENMHRFCRGIPSVSLGPPKFNTEYRDPTPVVLSADTLEVLTEYSPNVIALNDILHSQLVLTRRLLDTNRALLNSLTSSLKPDYQYTTLEDTRQYIQEHRPTILTFSEAKKRTKHKQD